MENACMPKVSRYNMHMLVRKINLLTSTKVILLLEILLFLACISAI